jgi:Zn-dependent protease with chaperone function
MQAHPDGIDFYFGHELGHVRMKHLTGRLLRAPVLWLPLLGPAYARAKESTCDRHGRACCESPESAARAMVALAAGAASGARTTSSPAAIRGSPSGSRASSIRARRCRSATASPTCSPSSRRTWGAAAAPPASSSWRR